MSSLVISNYNYGLSDDTPIFNYNFCDKYLMDNVDLLDTSIKGYQVCLNHFINWLKANDIKQPKKEDIIRYKLYLKESNYAINTKNQYLKAVRHLFKWLNANSIYPNITDDIKGFKDKSNTIKKDAFNEEDIKKIISDIDTNTIQGKRDKAIILLMLTGGLRINEVSLIDIRDIEVKNNQYIVNIQSKGYQNKNSNDRDTYIKIIKPVYDAIKDYLDTRVSTNKYDALFVSTSNRALNKRLTKQSLSQILKNRFRASGYDSDKLTAHSIRHTTATMLLKSGATLYKTQHHLRHKDPKTTEVYINLNDKESDTSEQDIYNQVFNTNIQDEIKTLRDEINNLNDNQIKDVLNYINSIKNEVDM